MRRIGECLVARYKEFPFVNLWFTEYSNDRVARMTTSDTAVEFNVTANSGPDAIVAGLENNLWFAEMGGNRIGSLTTCGVLSKHLIDTVNSQPTRLAVSADGTLWFTEWGTSRIGHLTLASPAPTMS